MTLKDTTKAMKTLLEGIVKDLDKAEAGNKAAAQRVRTSSIRFEKAAKLYRKESVKAAKSGELKRAKASAKKKKASTKTEKVKVKAKAKAKTKVKAKAPAKAKKVVKAKKKVAKRSLARKKPAAKVAKRRKK
ncbi:MAG: histone [Verrucomicrobia bacterium]|nr:histone [Verrucomicrobiota bacterium]MBS0645130.1 histone [Verrucomicrobiota bacterium]